MNYDFDEAPENEHGGARNPEWAKNRKFSSREHHMEKIDEPGGWDGTGFPSPGSLSEFFIDGEWKVVKNFYDREYRITFITMDGSILNNWWMYNIRQLTF